MNKYSYLKDINFFLYFNESDLRKYLKEEDIKIKDYENEDEIIFQGEKLKNAIFVLRGVLKGCKNKENGKVIEVERFSTGSLIAPVFIFAKENIIPVDLVSVGKSRIISIERESFFNLLMSNSKAMREFLKASSEKTHVISEKIVENTETIGEKVKKYIRENSEFEKIRFQFTMKELSEQFSVERPSLSRVISKYIKDGKLKKIEKNFYSIEDKDFFL
ncbi:MAG: Crp/Fnr family transcriptional regulator [Fusobacteriaceae bacterium]